MADAKPVDLHLGTFGDDLLQRVMRAFGHETFIVLPFFSVDGEIIDLRRRTQTARKAFVEAAGTVWFLKELPWYCSSVAFARFQGAMMQGLRDAHVKVPALCRSTTDGEPFVVDRWTGAVFQLQETIEGAGWQHTPAHAEAAGAALGRLHRAAAGLTLPAVAGMRDMFGSSAALVSLLAADAGGDERFAPLHFASTQTLRDSARRAVAAGYGHVRHGVHGDFNPFNLVFAGSCDQGIGVLDFDNACVDDPVHDVAEALVRFGWMRYRGVSSSYGSPPDSFDVEQLAAILRGYASTGQLGPRELVLLPDAMVAVALELAAIGLLSGYYTADDLPTLEANARSLPRLAQQAVSAAQLGLAS